MRGRSGWFFGFVALASTACGSSPEPAKPTFDAAVPPDDACLLLTTSDVQTLILDAGFPTRPATTDTADVWWRMCTYTSESEPGSAGLALHVKGARTARGQQELEAESQEQQDWGVTENTLVEGVGEFALYGVDASTHFSAVGALSGAYLVELTVVSDPPPDEGAIEALVVEVLGEVVPGGG